MKSYFNETYLPQIIKIGKFTCWFGAFFVFVPALIVTFFFDIVPDRNALATALVAQISINAVWWFIEPISFFTILGIPGTYMAFLSGNIGNLRIPSAAAALKATNTKLGTDEGSIISTIGVAASVFVNIILLVIGVFIGSQVLSHLPSAVVDSFNFLLPALFGAVFAQFAIDTPKIGVCGMGLGVASLLCYQAGWFNWIPLDPYIANILLPIFGTMIFARLIHKEEKNDKAP